MKKLIENQKVNMDNHKRGQFNDFNGLHIHKRMNGNNKRLGKVEVLVDLSGEITFRNEMGEQANRLMREIRDALQNKDKNAIFVRNIITELDKWKPDLSDKECVVIANNILSAFGVDAQFIKVTYHKNYLFELEKFKASFKKNLQNIDVTVTNKICSVCGKAQRRKS